jgi:hypothetical protein
MDRISVRGTALHRPIRDVVKDAIREADSAIRQNREVLRIILREGLAGDPVATRRYGQLLDGWETRLTDHLGVFESTGILAPGEARLLTRRILYAIIMAYEDRLLLRANPSLPSGERRLQTLEWLFRSVEWLLPPKLFMTDEIALPA